MINDKNYRLFSQFTKSMLAISAALVFSSASYALSTDRNQPADIDADDVEIDFKTGKRVFKGNVRVIQGTLRIKANKVVAQYKDGELVDATAYGSPAKFRQRPDGKPNDVEGEGKTIYVNKKNNSLTLKKNASLKQGFDTARGQEIFYNMANDTLKVKSGPRPKNGPKKSTISTGKTKANAAKQKDNNFFKDKPTTTDSNKPNSSETNEAEAPAINRGEELPEKLVLPKKQKTTKTGRSRLIIVPK